MDTKQPKAQISTTSRTEGRGWRRLGLSAWPLPLPGMQTSSRRAPPPLLSPEHQPPRLQPPQGRPASLPQFIVLAKCSPHWDVTCPQSLGAGRSLLASWKIPEAEPELRGRTWQQGAGRWGSSLSAPLGGERQRLSPGGSQGTPSTNATSSCGPAAGTAAKPSLYHLQQSIYSQ